jgi:pimeloyl-ACP methyl ester carboxylesterase
MLKRLFAAGTATALLTAFVSYSAPTEAEAVTAAPAAKPAPSFKPTRFSVEVRGSGQDVILIPGLASSRDIWNGTVAGVPGYRYHLVQVNGFAGAPVGGNASGKVVSGVADEIARYIAAKGLKRPALVGHSMGGTVRADGRRAPARRSVGKVMVVDMTPQPAGFVGQNAAGVRGLADTLQALSATPNRAPPVGIRDGEFGGPQQRDGERHRSLVARATMRLAGHDLTSELEWHQGAG